MSADCDPYGERLNAVLIHEGNPETLAVLNLDHPPAFTKVPGDPGHLRELIAAQQWLGA